MYYNQPPIKDLEQEVADWKEANSYMRFALAFAALALIAQVISFISLFSDHLGKFFTLLVLAYVAYAMSGFYKRKADDLVKRYK